VEIESYLVISLNWKGLSSSFPLGAIWKAVAGSYDEFVDEIEGR
jgi:hypothetical protein